MMKCDNCGKTGNFGHKFHRRIYPNLFFSHYKVKETIQFCNFCYRKLKSEKIIG